MAAPTVAKESFMESALVTWVHTFKVNRDPVTYEELCDCVFLNDVMYMIDPKAGDAEYNRTVEDLKERIQNWDILLKRIKSYYQDVLQQLIVMKLPNILTISKQPESDAARQDLHRVLLLILGCAVQCDEKKEQFIENIKELDVGTQHAIVDHIREITEDTKNVVAIEIAEDQLSEMSHSMHEHLRTLIQERDGYVEEIKELYLEELCRSQHQESQEKSGDVQGLSPTSATVTPEKHHMGVELAECKAKLRKVRQELEEKVELTGELQEELKDQKALVAKLRNENLELTQDARAARTYRDELDILREKASRVDKFEVEITRYKEKLNELDFFKTRVDELREDNAILVETKNMLEDQLSNSHKRVESVIELENELMKYKQQVEDAAMERDKDRKKIQELVEQNAKLEFEKKISFNESANLEDELARARNNLQSGGSSLNDQLNETANTKILRLELENQRLQKRLEEMQDTALIENTSRILELEKENQRLSKKVGNLQESSSKETQNFIQLEQVAQNLTRDKERLEQTIETVKESSERQVKELERENKDLVQTVETLRERNEKTLDLRIKDIEKENKRLHESVQHMSSEVSRTEYENRQLQKANNKLQGDVNRMQELDEENQKIEKENTDLHKTVATLRLTCDKYETLEQEAANLEIDNQKLSKMVNSLKSNLAKMEALEQDNINLTVEVQRLERTLQTKKNSSSKVATLEQEKDELNRQIEQLKKSVESMKANKTKQEEMQVNFLELDNEKQRLQKNLDATVRRMQQLEKDSNDIEVQNQNMQKTIETLRLSVRKLDEVEKENKDMDLEIMNLQRDKGVLEKENKKLKQSLDVREASLDEANSKITAHERQIKSLRKSQDKTHDIENKLRELEKQNTELTQQSTLDKKTLSSLREELVNEKITTQQLTNDLDKLTQELEKVGISKEKLKAVEQAHGERYEVLQSMMQDTLNKSVEIKEEKIHALESRLEESKNRNRTLQEQLKSVKWELEALKQRREEEVLVSGAQRAGPPVAPKPTMPNATKEILELKDHMIQVERQNATLEAESKNLRSQTSKLQDRIDQLESHNSALQSHASSQQEKNNALQSQHAKLQVETATLKSQNSTLQSQNSTLHEQHNHVIAEFEHLKNEFEDVQAEKGSLESDQEALRQLHEQLTAEYEALISEHGSLKANHKALKTELKDLQEQQHIWAQEKDILNQLKHSLQQDRETMKGESKDLANLQMDYIHIKEENVRLQSAREKLNQQYKDLMAEHKTVKTEYNNLKLTHTELQGMFADCKDQLNSLDVEVSKTANRCEALNQLNVKLEEENRALMMQLQALLTQNQELLTQSLENKDQFHEEQRAYLEKLSELRRQKEKLEEKIMEQYKRYDPVKKKNRSFGANLVRKARGFIARNKSKDSERSKTIAFGPGYLSFSQDSPENSSLGSGSMGEDGNVGKKVKKRGRNRRTSAGDLLDDSPKLSKQNKGLARSTTALNMLKAQNSKNESWAIRGAKSSENLLTLETGPSNTTEGRHGDADSLSSNNSDAREWPSRPGRRRQLLHSESGRELSIGRNSSMSSDDNIPTRDTGPTRLREFPPLKNLNLVPRGPLIEPEVEPGSDKITLAQFLEESNRSPASRRKLLVSKSQDKKDDELETEHISDLKTPRSPTYDDTNSETSSDKQTPSSTRKLGEVSPSPRPQTDLSSSVLSQLSTVSSYSNRDYMGHNGSYASTPQSNPDRAMATSTPKYSQPSTPASSSSPAYSQPYQTRRYSDRPQQLQDRPMSPVKKNIMSQFSQRSVDSSRTSSHSSGSSNYATPMRASHSEYDVTDQSSYSRSQRPQSEYDRLPQTPSNMNFNSLPRKNSLGAPPRQNSSGSTPNNGPVMRDDNTSSRPNNRPASATLPRKGSSGYTRSPETERRSAAYRSASSEELDAGPSGQRYTPTQHKFESDPYHSQSFNGMSDAGMSQQYRPGNVRDLVRNFQESVQGGTAPVPPPRRHRDSRSPARSVLPNRPASATPLGRSQTPSFTPGAGRTLPLTPDERKQQNNPRPNAPPPPNKDGSPPKGKNAVWYEYGCV